MPPVVRAHLDYYAVLEILPSADLVEINAAFRRLAWRCHPDRNPAPGATLQFQDINEAHQVLFDPARRAAYDAQWHPELSTRHDVRRGSSRPRTHRRWYRHRPARAALMALIALLLVASVWALIFAAMDVAHSKSFAYAFDAPASQTDASSPDCGFSMEMVPVTYIDENGRHATGWEAEVHNCWGGFTHLSSLAAPSQQRPSRFVAGWSYR